MPNYLRLTFRFLLLLSSITFLPAHAEARRPLEVGVLAATQETFDTGTKPDYASGSVALATGSWILADAVLGSTADDRKIGAQAVRIQQSGKLIMDFYLPNGASTVTVQHAIYGTDASSSLGALGPARGVQLQQVDEGGQHRTDHHQHPAAGGLHRQHRGQGQI
ncbi:hypothetical protein ACFQT0_09450 [Hymenobacter humi]|uniref:Uncharacterized protein n=1 Tax=Hymenobacter humi TaxID=1411620 RepID=A0ABW2U6C7_9BACT